MLRPHLTSCLSSDTYKYKQDSSSLTEAGKTVRNGAQNRDWLVQRFPNRCWQLLLKETHQHTKQLRSESLLQCICPSHLLAISEDHLTWNVYPNSSLTLEPTCFRLPLFCSSTMCFLFIITPPPQHNHVIISQSFWKISHFLKPVFHDRLMVNSSQDKDSDFRVFRKRNGGYLPVPFSIIFFPQELALFKNSSH